MIEACVMLPIVVVSCSSSCPNTNKPNALVVNKCYHVANTANICVNRVVIRPDGNTGKHFRGRSGIPRRSCGRGRSMGCFCLSSISQIKTYSEKIIHI